MLGVVLHTAFSESDLRQWEYVLSHFQPDVLYIVGPEVPEGFVYQSAMLIADSSDLPAELSLVLLAPLSGRIVAGETSLADFEHPTDVLYWFGPDLTEHMDPDVYLPRPADHTVYVPTDTNDQMFAHVACAVVMWDRRCKGG